MDQMKIAYIQAEAHNYGAADRDPYEHLNDTLIPEAMRMSQKHEADIRFMWDGIEITVTYQQHSIAGAFLLAKQRGELSVIR